MIATIPIGPYERFLDNPLGLAVDSRTNTIYATNPLDGNVYTIDGRLNAVTRSVAIGGSPSAIAVGPAGAVFVAGARKVAVIHPSGNVTRVPIGGATRGIGVDTVRHVAYVTTVRGDVVAISHGATRVVAHAAEPWGIAVDGATGTLVVASSSEGSVAVLTDGPAANTA